MCNDLACVSPLEGSPSGCQTEYAISARRTLLTRPVVSVFSGPLDAACADPKTHIQARREPPIREHPRFMQDIPEYRFMPESCFGAYDFVPRNQALLVSLDILE